MPLPDSNFLFFCKNSICQSHEQGACDNREADGKIAISLYDAKSLEGYQIKGTAEYPTESDIVSAFKAMVEKMFNGAATAKGVLLITPEKVIVTTPGADNKKVL
ncbi:MAG: hypothetical protein LIO81_04090 [Clostridiales bacterium]|nr:hypothetical protein [Clostridiales bacterium]